MAGCEVGELAITLLEVGLVLTNLKEHRCPKKALSELVVRGSWSFRGVDEAHIKLYLEDYVEFTVPWNSKDLIIHSSLSRCRCSSNI